MLVEPHLGTVVGSARESIFKGIVAWYIHRSGRSNGFSRQLSYDAVHDAESDNVQHQIRLVTRVNIKKKSAFADTR